MPVSATQEEHAGIASQGQAELGEETGAGSYSGCGTGIGTGMESACSDGIDCGNIEEIATTYGQAQPLFPKGLGNAEIQKCEGLVIEAAQGTVVQ